MLRITALLLLSLLTACGGGDWDEEELRKEAPPIDCSASPQTCS